MDIADLFCKAIMFVMAVLTVIIFLGAGIEAGRISDLKNQCLADGHKEYECYSMLHGGRK